MFDNGIVDAKCNDSCNNCLEPPEQIVYSPSPQHKVDNTSSEIEKQVIQTQLAFARYENRHLHAQVAFFQSVYCLLIPQLLANNIQTVNGVVVVTDGLPAEEMEIGIIRSGGRRRGTRDRCKRLPRRCGLCK